MPANPWELRADVRPLDTAAQAWRDVAQVMTRRGDEIVEAARRATEGWDAATAEGYEQHRRRVLAHLDAFTTLAGDLAGSLQAISAVLTAAQKELDRSWLQVATVPHESVGESRHLVFHPADEQHHGTVARCRREAEDVRGRLRVALELEGGRLRTAGAELVVVRTGLTELAAGRFPGGWGSAGETGTGVPGAASTSVRGSAQAGVGALPPMAPISSVPVDMPDLAGLSPAAIGAAAAAAAAAAAGRRRPAAKGDPATGTPPVGGMAAGAAGARGGALSRGAAGGRAGARRMAAPRLEGPGASAGAGAGRGTASAAEADAEARKQAEKDAKRALLDEKRAERAARKARREADRRGTAVHDAPGEDPVRRGSGGGSDAPDADPGADGGSVER